jgi:hypothetical protein
MQLAKDSKELIAKKDKAFEESEAKRHDLIHKIKNLFAAKNDDICEFFINCDVANGNCVKGDNPQRQACKVAIRKAQIKAV